MDLERARKISGIISETVSHRDLFAEMLEAHAEARVQNKHDASAIKRILKDVRIINDHYIAHNDEKTAELLDAFRAKYIKMEQLKLPGLVKENTEEQTDELFRNILIMKEIFSSKFKKTDESKYKEAIGRLRDILNTTMLTDVAATVKSIEGVCDEYHIDKNVLTGPFNWSK